jgi:hypothetical protein
MTPRTKAVAVVVGIIAVCVGTGLFAWVAPEAFPWVLLAVLMLVVLYVVYKLALQFFELEL